MIENNSYNNKNKLLLKGKSYFYQRRDLIGIYLLKAKGLTVVDGNPKWFDDRDLLLDSTLIICERIEEICLAHFEVTDHPQEILR
jgi:hypothetical protein